VPPGITDFRRRLYFYFYQLIAKSGMGNSPLCNMGKHTLHNSLLNHMEKRKNVDSDFLLIQKRKMGSEQAIDLFVWKYYPSILKYCHLHIRDDGDAEEMAHETFERFFWNFHGHQHCGKAVNFLYVIAANCCKDYYRKRREIVTDELPEQTDNSMENMDWIDARIAIDKLPDEIREAAILFFFHELKQKEISKTLGIGLPLVKYDYMLGWT